MASAPEALPLFYKELVPLSSQQHGDWNGRPGGNLALLRGVHAVPLTSDELVSAGRNYPVVFTQGDDPVPLGLFGLNEGVNVFLGDDDMLVPDTYLPAYVRRYPWMLVPLQPDSQEMTLCCDPSSGLVGPDVEGTPLFVDGEPSADTKGMLQFCEDFQMAAQRTSAFMAELKSYDLLMDAEITIEQAGEQQPFVYRGFRMVNEEKLKALRGDQLRKMMQSGMLALIHAHLFSLQLMPVIFNRQYQAGQVSSGDGVA